MTDLPAAAIAAAAHAINAGLPGGLTLDEAPARRAAERALEAAAPHITAAERARLREPLATLTDWLEHLPQRHVPLRAAEALQRLRNLTAPGGTP